MPPRPRRTDVDTRLNRAGTLLMPAIDSEKINLARRAMARTYLGNTDYSMEDLITVLSALGIKEPA